MLTQYIQGRPLERLPAVDRAILRMAVWEMFFNHEIDRTIAISEATTIAADLSTDGSPGLVNAVLDRVRNSETAVAASLGVH